MRKVFNRNEGKITITDPTDTSKAVAITPEGRLSVDIDAVAQKPLKVSSPIMITRYDIDSTEISHNCSDSEDTLFKNWSFPGTYLRGITIVIEKKETIIKIFRNGNDLLLNLNCLDAEDLFSLNAMERPLHDMFSFHKNAVGAYVCSVNFDGTPFDTIDIKLRHAGTGSKDLMFRYGVIIYNDFYMI